MAGRRIAVTAGVAAVGLTALATGVVGSGQTAAAAGLEPFGSCAELGTWFRDAAEDLVGPWGLAPGWDMGMAGAAEDGTAGTGVARQDAAATGEAVGPGATGTNVQEAGVDEPDVAKARDGLLVTVSDGRLAVHDVTGVRARRLGEVALPGAALGTAGIELLLGDDVALVLGSAWGGPVPMAGEGVASDVADSSMPYGGGSTTLTAVDLSDPGDPLVVRSEEVEGRYVSARETDGVARLVVSATPMLPFVTPQSLLEGDDWATAERRAQARNVQVLRSASGEDWLPHSVERAADGTATRGEPVLRCDDVAHPAEAAGVGVVSVLTLDLTAPGVPTTGTQGVAADGDLVYASDDRLYVATTAGGWVRLMADGEPGRTTTALHGFDTTARDDVAYVASGEVDGWLLGRWALSAEDGRLRVAATRQRGNSTDSAVTVLAERGDRLVRAGSVGGLGKGEQVRAVRWFGDLAVVVTFRQTDPLYTVDLSDPADPRVVGELKVPGYSAYLHPLGDDLLLGVGQDADPRTGQVRGGQLATYDLRDLARPEQLDVLVDRGAWWDVEADSRAFAYLPQSRTALVSGYDGAKGTVLTAVRVAADGALSERGRFSPGSEGWLLRAVPLDEDRVAAVSAGPGGVRVALLDTDLEPLA